MREDRKEFAARRSGLIKTLGLGNMGIVLGATETFRNSDANYPFRQDSDFYYLTGVKEPGAIALFVPGRVEGEFILLVQNRNPAQEIWTGPRIGSEGAIADYGADQAFSLQQTDEIITKILPECQSIYYPMGKYSEFDARVLSWLKILQAKSRGGIRIPNKLENIECIIHEQRLIKTDFEIRCMQRAAEITIAGHERAMQYCQPGLYEYELEAELQHEFIRRASRFCAYESIVGSGPNSCTLHYVDNMAQMQDGDLVLIDAGAEYNYYASDVTRTFPINGRFTPDQRAIYNLVLETQLAVINSIRPGVLWDYLEEVAVRTLTKGLLILGILKGELDYLLAEKAYKSVYMHRIGHWLGLDVHDVGSYQIDGQSRPLMPGMVLTVEPGIYVPEGSPGIDKRWWGIGVRIEDDVWVTEKGHKVLTGDLIKTVEDIEACLTTTS